MKSKMTELRMELDKKWIALTSAIDTITMSENLNNPQVIQVIDKMRAKREMIEDVIDMSYKVEGGRVRVVL